MDIAAGAAEDADGNGNTVVPRFSVGITYDDGDDGDISTAEVLAAIIVSRAAGSEDTEVRLGSPVSLTATFTGRYLDLRSMTATVLSATLPGAGPSIRLT